MSIKNSDRRGRRGQGGGVGKAVWPLALGFVLVAGAARGEEEPFAADEGESPAQSLRKALRKMSRVEESARTWLERPDADSAGQAPPAELLAGISARQKEIADDLSRLVLKLQEG